MNETGTSLASVILMPCWKIARTHKFKTFELAEREPIKFVSGKRIGGPSDERDLLEAGAD